MLLGGILVPLLWAAISTAIAVWIQRRWPDSVRSSIWINASWALACCAASVTVLEHAPPLPWSLQASQWQPWESIIVPLAICGLAWPFLRSALHNFPQARLLVVMALAFVPLIASLPPADGYADLMPGNAIWCGATLLAIGCNSLAGEYFRDTGAARWSLWVYVAQLMTTAALLLACFASLGEWTLAAALSLACVAIGRQVLREGTWAICAGIPATILSCCLLFHVRDYSTTALPAWLAPVPLLMPVMVSLVDLRFGRRWNWAARVALAAAVSVGLSILSLLSVLSSSSGESEW